MNETKIQELLKTLFRAKYTWNSGDSNYTTYIINESSRTEIELIIRNFLLENRDEQLGILQAKVFMYEEIISKSNFAPMIKDVSTKNNTKSKTPNQ